MTQQDPTDWLDTYLGALPANIRPDSQDRRLQAAAAAARGNGWTSRQAANVVTQRNYAGKHNPTLIGIMELERIGQRPPAASRPVTSRVNASGCIVCPPGVTCDDPITEPMNPVWIAERTMLLRQLMASDMTEDEREHAMASLIGRQRATIAR
jgi:hypothetical protein